MVTLQVAGHTEDGKAVDWNRSLEFILGEEEVIQGQPYGNSSYFFHFPFSCMCDNILMHIMLFSYSI